MKHVSEACRNNDHQHCDGSIYRKEPNGMEIAAEPCWCGCHVPHLRGKNIDAIIDKARSEEDEIFDRLAERFR